MSAQEGLKAIMDEPANRPVIRKLLITTVAMIVIPIAVFFGVRVLAATHFGLNSSGSNLWAGIASAVSVNVVMVYYVVLAWNGELAVSAKGEGEKTAHGTKKDR